MSEWAWTRQGPAQVSRDGRHVEFPSGQRLPKDAHHLGARTPRRPALFPGKLSAMHEWAKQSDPSLARILISESGPISPGEIQRELVKCGIFQNLGDARNYWKRASRKLTKDPHIVASGKGTATRYSYLDSPVSAPVGKPRIAGNGEVRAWLMGETRREPIAGPRNKALTEAEQVLDGFIEWASAPKSNAKEWSLWTKRIQRIYRLAHLLGLPPQLGNSVAKALDMSSRFETKSARDCLQELTALLKLLQESGASISVSPDTAIALASSRNTAARTWESLVGVGWSSDDWKRLLHLLSQQRSRIPASQVMVFARAAAEYGQPESADRLSQLMKDKLPEVEEAWRVLLQLGSLETASSPSSLVDSARGFIERALAREAGRRASARVVDDLLKESRAEGEAEAEAALKGKHGEVEVIRKQVEEERNALQEQVSLFEKERELLEARAVRGQSEAAEMAGRLDQVRAEEQLEARAEGWRLVANAIEDLIDIEKDVPVLSSVIRALESELAATSVRPVAARGGMAKFDPKFYEWFGTGEPPLEIRVARRPYEFAKGGLRLVVMKGLARGDADK